jgi:hypothetical protein
MVDAVYFPLDCVVSSVVGAGEALAVEMGTVGREAVGVLSILNPQKAIG